MISEHFFTTRFIMLFYLPIREQKNFIAIRIACLGDAGAVVIIYSFFLWKLLSYIAIFKPNNLITTVCEVFFASDTLLSDDLFFVFVFAYHSRSIIHRL